jgi:hypothetical protein
LGGLWVKVFWFFFSRKNSSPFLKKGSQKLLPIQVRVEASAVGLVDGGGVG